MYYPYFLTYIVIGFALTLVVFAWAIRNGQFKDQDRARYLPLQGEPDPVSVRHRRFSRWEVYGLFFLAVAGLAASAAVLCFALLHAN